MFVDAYFVDFGCVSVANSPGQILLTSQKAAQCQFLSLVLPFCGSDPSTGKLSSLLQLTKFTAVFSQASQLSVSSETHQPRNELREPMAAT